MVRAFITVLAIACSTVALGLPAMDARAANLLECNMRNIGKESNPLQVMLRNGVIPHLKAYRQNPKGYAKFLDLACLVGNYIDWDTNGDTNAQWARYGQVRDLFNEIVGDQTRPLGKQLFDEGIRAIPAIRDLYFAKAKQWVAYLSGDLATMNQVDVVGPMAAEQCAEQRTRQARFVDAKRGLEAWRPENGGAIFARTTREAQRRQWLGRDENVDRFCLDRGYGVSATDDVALLDLYKQKARQYVAYEWGEFLNRDAGRRFAATMQDLEHLIGSGTCAWPTEKQRQQARAAQAFVADAKHHADLRGGFGWIDSLAQGRSCAARGAGELAKNVQLATNSLVAEQARQLADLWRFLWERKDGSEWTVPQEVASVVDQCGIPDLTDANTLTYARQLVGSFEKTKAPPLIPDPKTFRTRFLAAATKISCLQRNYGVEVGRLPDDLDWAADMAAQTIPRTEALAFSAWFDLLGTTDRKEQQNVKDSIAQDRKKYESILPQSYACRFPTEDDVQNVWDLRAFVTFEDDDFKDEAAHFNNRVGRARALYEKFGATPSSSVGALVAPARSCRPAKKALVDDLRYFREDFLGDVKDAFSEYAKLQPALTQSVATVPSPQQTAQTAEPAPGTGTTSVPARAKPDTSTPVGNLQMLLESGEFKKAVEYAQSDAIGSLSCAKAIEKSRASGAIFGSDHLTTTSFGRKSVDLWLNVPVCPKVGVGLKPTDQIVLGVNLALYEDGINGDLPDGLQLPPAVKTALFNIEGLRPVGQKLEASRWLLKDNTYIDPADPKKFPADLYRAMMAGKAQPNPMPSSDPAAEGTSLSTEAPGGAPVASTQTVQSLPPDRKVEGPSTESAVASTYPGTADLPFFGANGYYRSLPSTNALRILFDSEILEKWNVVTLPGKYAGSFKTVGRAFGERHGKDPRKHPFDTTGWNLCQLEAAFWLASIQQTNDVPHFVRTFFDTQRRCRNTNDHNSVTQAIGQLFEVGENLIFNNRNGDKKYLIFFKNNKTYTNYTAKIYSIANQYYVWLTNFMQNSSRRIGGISRANLLHSITRMDWSLAQYSALIVARMYLDYLEDPQSGSTEAERAEYDDFRIAFNLVVNDVVSHWYQEAGIDPYAARVADPQGSPLPVAKSPNKRFHN